MCCKACAQGRPGPDVKTGDSRLTDKVLAIIAGLLYPVMACALPVGPVAEQLIRSRADALLAQMTPEEKAGQMSEYFYLSPYPQVTRPLEEKIARGEVGALLFVSDPATTNRLQRIAREQTRLKIPLLFGYDVIHGLKTIFPVPIALAASWDPRLVEHVQSLAASEARAVGIDWTFGPDVDIARDPRWGRIVEGAGEDPYLGSIMAAAQVRGFQGGYIGAPAHVLAGPKHFAGYGAAIGGRDYDEVNLSDEELWNVYLPPFKAAVDAGAGNIMSAYMELNGLPATADHWLLTTVLRETWGFRGFVVSDSGAVRSLSTQGLTADPAGAAERAVAAGVNMEMAPPAQSAAVAELPGSLRAGRISQAWLDEAVRPILETKIRMGLFENPYVDEKQAVTALDNPEHEAAAREAAERSAVLLRNDHGVLPLDLREIKSLAVIGPLADAPRDTLGPWVFKPNNPTSVSIVAGIRAKCGASVRVEYAQGVQMPDRLYPSPMARMDGTLTPKPPWDDSAGIERAVALARATDVTILVVGEAQDMAGEQASRSTLDLPGRQQDLLNAVVAVGKPVVVILMSARPLDLKDTAASAILDIWYPGSEGGPAVADLLFGDTTPGGKLPFSWIRDAGQAPTFYAHRISHSPAATDKRYWNETSTPRYPFGYGLSYTSFEYSDLQIEHPQYRLGQPISLSVKVKNTGTRTGDEVAQLYIHQRTGTSTRPVRELKGFQRLSLQAGESRTLKFSLTAADLTYWSSVTHGWIQDESAFDVWIGGSSAAQLGGSFIITATQPKHSNATAP